jgi:hypothetical protein
LCSDAKSPLKGLPARAGDTISEKFKIVRAKFDKREALPADVFELIKKIAERKEVHPLACCSLLALRSESLTLPARSVCRRRSCDRQRLRPSKA